MENKALAKFLAAHPIPENSKLYEGIPDEVFESNVTSENEVWQMFFDEASRIGPKGRIIAGVGVMFISPQNHVLPRAFSVIPRSWNTYLAAYSVFRSYFSIYFPYLTDFNFKYHFPLLYICLLYTSPSPRDS